MNSRTVARTVSLITLIAAILLSSTTPAQSATYWGWFYFKKNSSDQTSSTLLWHYTDGISPSGTQKITLGRAGSGVTKNDCEIGKGWLPSDFYGARLHDHDYPGTQIRGRVWYIDDKLCSAGTAIRTELFIHTEETMQNTQQGCVTGGDGPWCWESAKDYKSAACVKVSHKNYGFPDTVGSAHARFHNTSTGGYASEINSIKYFLNVGW